MSQKPLSLRCRWMISSPGPSAQPEIVENAVITILGGRIVSLSNRDAAPERLDLGDAVVLPALVNAHTHLEFSDLPAPVGRPGVSLPQWLTAAMSDRATRGDVEAAIERGLQESLSLGVGAIGEIAQSNAVPQTAGPMPLVAGFRELRGWQPERRKEILRTAAGFLAQEGNPGFAARGLSPHCPPIPWRRQH